MTTGLASWWARAGRGQDLTRGPASASRGSRLRGARFGSVAPRLPRALSSRSAHRAAGARARDQCPVAWGPSAQRLSCWVPTCESAAGMLTRTAALSWSPAAVQADAGVIVKAVHALGASAGQHDRTVVTGQPHLRHPGRRPAAGFGHAQARLAQLIRGGLLGRASGGAYDQWRTALTRGGPWGTAPWGTALSMSRLARVHVCNTTARADLATRRATERMPYVPAGRDLGRSCFQRAGQVSGLGQGIPQ
jgi:hypothetical protein